MKRLLLVVLAILWIPLWYGVGCALVYAWEALCKLR